MAATTNSPRRAGARLPSRSFALALSYVGFVSLGLPDTTLGPAWPAIRAHFGLPLDAAGLAVLLTTAGVVVSSASSAWLRARIGTAAVLAGSTIIAAVALALNAIAPRWSFMLIAAFVAGLGGGAVDASLNHLVALRYSARHMNWLHACWGVGASLTPILVAAQLAAGHSWRRPYGLLAVAELVLAFAFLLTRDMWRDDGRATPDADRSTSIAQSRAAWAGVVLFFVYGGVEAGTGLWASSLLTITRGASAATAGALVAVYWGALTVGRFVLGGATTFWGADRLLRTSVRIAVCALAALSFPTTPLWFAGLALAVLGFALAPVYPLLMHDTSRRFGAVAARLVGFQVAACSVGIALLPWLVGIAGARAGVLVIPPVLCLLAVVVSGLEIARRRKIS